MKHLGLGLGIIGVLFLLLLGPILGSICWPYAINHWLIYFHKDPVLVWWQGALIGLVPGFGQMSIPAAIATWILMMFLV